MVPAEERVMAYADGLKAAAPLLYGENTVETLPDSGERAEFETGAVRDTAAGKGRYDLLPPEAVRRWALRLEAGMQKYGERNWERGIPLGRFIDSTIRHAFQLSAGDESEDHAAAILFNAGAFIQTLKWIDDGVLPAELDDRPPRMRGTQLV